MRIFRRISFAIVQAIVPLIPSLYDIFNVLAKNEFFTDKQIRGLSNNIYIFVSVCMLFALGIRLINGIVNPELLNEKKKGVKSAFFNAFAAVILIIVIPVGFDTLRKVQGHIIDSKVIEKVFLGTELSEKQSPGQIIAAYTFSSFCHPNKEVSSEELDSNGQDLYNKALTEDISLVSEMEEYINDGKGFGKKRVWDFEYNPILAPAASIVVGYELVIMCMDLALRSIKLGLLELIAPVILCGFIFKGPDLLQKWFKEVITTWVLLFLKVAMVVFMIYGLALLPGFLDRIEMPEKSGAITRGLIKMFILIGLLQVIKQLPNIINSVFGTNIQSRGGIRGRLGEMAAVGGLAQRGWDQLRQHPIQTTTGIVAAPAAAIGGIGTHLAAVNGRVRDLRERAAGAAAAGNHDEAARYRRRAIGAGIGGLLTSGLAGVRAGTSTLRTGNLQGVGEQAARYRETHPENSTLRGTIEDRARAALGLRTRQEVADRNDNDVTYNGQRMSVDQLTSMKNSNEAVVNARNGIREAAVNAVEDRNSRFNLTGHEAVHRRNETLRNRLRDANNRLTAAQADLAALRATGTATQEELDAQQAVVDAAQNAVNNINDTRNAYAALNRFTNNAAFNYDSLTRQINNLSAVNLQQGQGESDAAFAARVAAHNREVEELQRSLNLVHEDARDNIVEEAVNANPANLHQVLTNLHLSGRDIGIIGTGVNTAREIMTNSPEEAANFDYDGFNNTYQTSQAELNNINTTLTAHQQEVYQRHNDERHREMEASQAAARAQRNRNNQNNGNNS